MIEKIFIISVRTSANGKENDGKPKEKHLERPCFKLAQKTFSSGRRHIDGCFSVAVFRFDIRFLQIFVLSAEKPPQHCRKKRFFRRLRSGARLARLF